MSSRRSKVSPSLALLFSGSALLLLAIAFGPLLLYWTTGWLSKSISVEHDYYSHGLIGLPLAAWLSWRNRRAWTSLPDCGHWLGAVCLVAAVLAYLSGLMDLLNLSLPLLLLGLCLWLKGWAGLQLQGLPLLLVVLATPTSLPYLLTPYTLPLQRLIATVAGLILMQVGLEVRVEQIYLYVNDQIVEIAPYCAGLKMLFASLYAGILLLYWTGAWRSRWVTIAFLASILGINTTANILRNTLLAYFHGTQQTAAFDWLHESWGGDLYSVGVLGALVFVLRGVEWAIARLTPPAADVHP